MEESRRNVWQAFGHVGLKLGSNQEIEEDIWESLSDVPWRKLRGG